MTKDELLIFTDAQIDIYQMKINDAFISSIMNKHNLKYRIRYF